MGCHGAQPDQFSYGNADQTASFATSNGKLLRCHALVWHSQLPSWGSNIRNSNTLTSVLQNHIANVAGHFKGKCYAWDVINEMQADHPIVGFKHLLTLLTMLQVQWLVI